MKKKYYYKINYKDSGYNDTTGDDTDWWDVITTDKPKTTLASLHPSSELWDFPLEASTDTSVMQHPDDRFISLSQQELTDHGKRLTNADVFLLKV